MESPEILGRFKPFQTKDQVGEEMRSAYFRIVNWQTSMKPRRNRSGQPVKYFM